ncbi:MAG: DUF1643 domain-containing protein [Nevskiaceae bacterium]|nr:MAG: DUF1643 domain-containing protein [Nevskiaceae bacterium]
MIERQTIFSLCRCYRYTLWREWGGLFDDDGRFVMFIGLNPSTADETRNDQTILKCMSYARAWGFTAMCMTNLFAYRATDPKVMKAHTDPIGADNDRWLKAIFSEASLVVAAWGVDGNHMGRSEGVLDLLPAEGMKCLGKTKGGEPRHPLYLPGDLEPVAMEA